MAALAPLLPYAVPAFATALALVFGPLVIGFGTAGLVERRFGRRA